MDEEESVQFQSVKDRIQNLSLASKLENQPQPTKPSRKIKDEVGDTTKPAINGWIKFDNDKSESKENISGEKLNRLPPPIPTKSSKLMLSPPKLNEPLQIQRNKPTSPVDRILTKNKTTISSKPTIVHTSIDVSKSESRSELSFIKSKQVSESKEVVNDNRLKGFRPTNRSDSSPKQSFENSTYTPATNFNTSKQQLKKWDTKKEDFNPFADDRTGNPIKKEFNNKIPDFFASEIDPPELPTRPKLDEGLIEPPNLPNRPKFNRVEVESVVEPPTLPSRSKVAQTSALAKKPPAPAPPAIATKSTVPTPPVKPTRNMPPVASKPKVSSDATPKLPPVAPKPRTSPEAVKPKLKATSPEVSQPKLPPKPIPNIQSQPQLPPKPNSKLEPKLPPKPLLDKMKPNLPPKPKLETTDNVGRAEPPLPARPNRDRLRSPPLPMDSIIIDTTNPNRSLPSLNWPDLQVKGPIRHLATLGRFLVCQGAGPYLKGFNLITGDLIFNLTLPNETKVTSLLFRPTRMAEDLGWFLWAGLNDGQLLCVDVAENKVVDRRASCHSYPVLFMGRVRNRIVSLDEGGSLLMWPERADDDTLLQHPTFEFKARSSRIQLGKSPNIVMVGNTLWIASLKHVEAYNLLIPSTPSIFRLDLQSNEGNITCITSSANLQWVILGHHDGKVTIIDANSKMKLLSCSLQAYRIASLLLVMDRYLWVTVTTQILVYDLQVQGNLPSNRWKLLKVFSTHDSPITNLQFDPHSLLVQVPLHNATQLPVVSYDENGGIKVWDGLLQKDWKASKLENRLQYCTLREVNVRICSWNIDACKPVDLLSTKANAEFLDQWLGQDRPDLIIVGFQETVDLESKKMTAKSIFKKKEETGDILTQRYKRWQSRLQKVADDLGEYKLVECQNLVGLFTCIFIKQDEHIDQVEVALVKTGFGGLHGNKGAITVRFLWDDTSLAFVNCHIAAGQKEISARNNDVSTIFKKTTLPLPSQRVQGMTQALQMDPDDNLPLFVNGGDGQHILDHEIVVFSGDLNYRIDLHRDQVEELIKYSDFDQLLEFDQLTYLRRSAKASNAQPFLLANFQEPQIHFPPTYKFDPGTNRYDTSEKRRCPAWCDRILFKGVQSNIIPLSYKGFNCDVSDHRPIAATLRCQLKTVQPNRLLKLKTKIQNEWDKYINGFTNLVFKEYLVELGYKTNELDFDKFGVLTNGYEILRNKYNEYYTAKRLKYEE